jgi:spore germination cell wall hydrolase CwlJ-like protein
MRRLLYLPILLATLFVFFLLYTESKTEVAEVPRPVSIQELAQPIALKKVEVAKPSVKETKEREFHSKHNEIKQKTDKKEYFLAYKKLTSKYIKWIDPPETVFDVFTEEEVRLICKAVETECYQQEFDAKVNVASVIFNRIKSGEFGDTVTKVITSPNQFAYGRDAITEDTILAVQYAYEIEDTTNGCVAFRSGKKPEKWYNWKLIFIDEAGHGFYK